ncbi:divergent polysaccharide deacetylase family protein [Sutcliffiella horikoshii]|uniref:Divergent polysaccharide deacetylase family protein n=1 Tax=Sutcliffiella horikoshii TaxID=79883 RepID=A0A5D4TA37_9BACI|nr:divergent polysaccharide deacetylase family protein [Sutcliffiella horikoshii]TYS70974.1 divergent polysaccharide deacetylase family protein [Sutcliffiella horikoshii]
MKVIVVIMLSSMFIFSFPSINPSAEELPSNKVAIVIDDFGNNMKGTEEILHLPVPLTVAVMPFLSTTKEDAELAHQLGHEVILHLPMEPLKGKRSWLGPGAITSNLSDEEIYKRVNDAIDSVPYAVGINNHMGSKITADKRIMKIILGICKERNLYYLDSKTTKKSVVSELATELGVPFLENELFFDEVYTTTHIVKQTNQLIKKTEVDDSIIAIGHVGIVGEKTASVLKQYIPKLQEKAEIVTLSNILVDKEILMH